MKHLIVMALASLLLLLGACTQNNQETPEIGIPTASEGEEVVVVVPTQVVEGSPEGASPRPEENGGEIDGEEGDPPVALATAEPVVAEGGEQPAVCEPRTEWVAYVVDTGDTLGRIAQRTDSSIGALAEANCLSDVNSLVVGETLYVPTAPTAENPEEDFVRIRFAAGEDRTRIAGELGENEVHDYVFSAQKGQLLSVGFGEWNGARVWVESFNGEQLAQGIGDHAAYLLPETGDYLLKVTGDAAVAYELFVSIPADVTANVPERVQFEAGATSAVVSGESAASIPQYVVSAGAGQVLNLELAEGVFLVAVRGADGQRLFDFNDAQPYPSYGPIVLPTTQDYVISILAIGSESYGINVPYELTIEIVDGG